MRAYTFLSSIAGHTGERRAHRWCSGALDPTVRGAWPQLKREWLHSFELQTRMVESNRGGFETWQFVRCLARQPYRDF